MDAYRRTIDEQTTLILSSESDFFRWLGPPRTPPAP
jgi:hypothetical protein